LKLLKCVFGLKQALITCFEKLKTGLLEHCFEQSDFDSQMKNGIICVVCVDDTIFDRADGEELEKETESWSAIELSQFFLSVVK